MTSNLNRQNITTETLKYAMNLKGENQLELKLILRENGSLQLLTRNTVHQGVTLLQQRIR